MKKITSLKSKIARKLCFCACVQSGDQPYEQEEYFSFYQRWWKQNEKKAFLSSLSTAVRQCLLLRYNRYKHLVYLGQLVDEIQAFPCNKFKHVSQRNCTKINLTSEANRCTNSTSKTNLYSLIIDRELYQFGKPCALRFLLTQYILYPSSRRPCTLRCLINGPLPLVNFLIFFQPPVY